MSSSQRKQLQKIFIVHRMKCQIQFLFTSLIFFHLITIYSIGGNGLLGNCTPQSN